MKTKTYTVDDIMMQDPCYNRAKVEVLWGDKEALTQDEICNLDIPDNDKAWFIQKFQLTICFEYANGSKEWYVDGNRHRDDGMPAVEYANGSKEWWVDGNRHRDDGMPAVEYADGSKEWWVDGNRHRDDGMPAVEYADGSKAWYVDGNRHRDDGMPAVEYADGSKAWWVDGKFIRGNR